jgi:tagatose-6-phosphate ketose/aldose isomerase
MKNALGELLNLESGEKKRRGVLHTASEIAGQVALWEDSARRVRETAREAQRLLQELQESPGGCLVCTGAGTSEYTGYCLEGLARKSLAVPVNVFSTPRIVTTPEDIFFPNGRFLLLSFARSGDSPESVGAARIATKTAQGISHIVITCNQGGGLARWASTRQRSLTVCLDERTNDRGLAMTSSFTNMLVAGQALFSLRSPEYFSSRLAKLIEAGSFMLTRAPDIAKEVCSLDFNRALFLGNGCGWGTAVESHLKLQELTAGGVMCAYDTFLGLRHGPEALIDERTLVVAYLSSHPLLRRYEEDLLRELKHKHIGRALVVCGAGVDSAIGNLSDYVVDFDPGGRLDIPDDFLSPVHIIFGQLLGLFKSLMLGNRPDTPSEGGIIHRVVQGVRIYDPEAFALQGRFDVIAER